MYSIRKSLNLSETEDKIRKVGLKNLNLLEKNSFNYKYFSPKKSILKKSLSKTKLLFYINSPKSVYHSKIKFTPVTPNFNNSFSQPKNSKFNSTRKTYLQSKQKFFDKNLLLSKNINNFSPKTKGFKSTDNHDNRKVIKNSFSNNYKATSASTFYNMNLILDKTATSFRSQKINLNQIKRHEIKEEKNMFEKKLKRKKQKEESKENILFENRKKYPFIKAFDYFKFQKSMAIPESISKFNKKLYSVLLKENSGIFQHPINIIKKGKFSEKFEIPRDIEINQHKEEYYKAKDIHIGEYILKKEEVKKEENEIIKEKNKRIILNKFLKKMMEIYLINKNLKIPITEIIKQYKKSNRIFNFDQTRHLNNFIKTKNLNKALLILSSFHHLVIDIDQFYMTPLHYAAKYNFYKIIPYLMSYGAYVDAKTSFGMTPLMLCFKKNYYESMIILFLHMANPFLKIYSNNNINDNDIDYKTKNILKRIKLIYFKNRIYRDKNFYLSVQSDIYDFVI